MPTHQESLFPDDETPALVPLGVTGSAHVLTPAQKRFNQLVAEIERARRDLAEWQAAETELQANAAAALPPRRAELRTLQREMVVLLDGLLGPSGPKLSRRRRDAVRAAVAELAAAMLEQEHDDELAAIHDRHADLTLQEQEQFEAEMAREVLGEMLGEQALPGEGASLEEVLQTARAHLEERAAAEDEQEQRRAHKRAERRRARGKGPTRQEKLEQARHEAGQSLREVYRRLASALHPDRVVDPDERSRRTVLMQRANQAYEAQDLLALLSLQIELEQIDAAHLAGLADERVQHYNLVLKEQLDAVQGEIVEHLRRYDLHRPGHKRPRELLAQVLEADLRGIAVGCAQLRHDLALLADPKRRLAVIDGWVAEQRQAELSDADLAMFGALMGLDDAPPRRPRRRR